MDESDLDVTAMLATIDLSDDERELLRGEIERMIGYFERMAAVDVSNLVPTTHVLSNARRVRPDVCRSSDVADRLLDLAPEVDDRFIVIPNVL